MKITDVSVTVFAWDDIPATRYNAHTGQFGGQSNLGLVRVETDQGLSGHAFLGSALYPAKHDAHALIGALKPVVMGADPLDRELLYDRLWHRQRQSTLRAIGAMDICLWDLAGQAAEMPCYKLMGAYRESVPAYASSALLDGAAAYAEEAVRFRDDGWPAYKIHPPTRWREDIAVCEAVRAAVGDDYTLMLDSTWSYKYEEALRVGRAIEALDYYWYEDPLEDDDIYGCMRLREKLDIRLLATEYSPGGFTHYAPWILLKATDSLRGDVAVKGGMTALLKTAHLAEAFGMRFEVHHGGNSLNNLANLHVILAIKNCEFFEVLLPHDAHKYAMATEIAVDGDGLVHAPSGPGLGADIDFDLIAAKTLEVLR